MATHLHVTGGGSIARDEHPPVDGSRNECLSPVRALRNGRFGKGRLSNSVNEIVDCETYRARLEELRMNCLEATLIDFID